MKPTYISKLWLLGYRNSTYSTCVIRNSIFEVPRNTYVTSSRFNYRNKILTSEDLDKDELFENLTIGSGEKKKIKTKKGSKKDRPGKTNTIWSRLELRVLENLVEKHGQNWDMISKHMVVRTASDCRNTYMAMVAMLPEAKRIKKEKILEKEPEKDIWTDEEIKLLDNLLTKYGRRWVKIEKYFPTKDIRTIENFVTKNPEKFSAFFKFPDRLGRAKTWSESEIKMLNDLLAKYGKNYDLIAKYLHGRSTMAVIRALPKHYLDLPTLRNIKFQKWFKFASRWSDREVNLLNNLVAHFGPDWISVAANLPGRTPTACKLKYNDCWNFHNDRTELTLHKWPQELSQVLDLIIAKYGRWQILPLLLPGITPMFCQANNLRIFHDIPPRYSEWKEHDKILLRHLIRKYDYNLDKVKPYFPHKTRTTESRKLLTLVKEFDSNWFKIAENLPGRTPSSCWLRFVILSRISNHVGKNWAIKDIICFIELFQKYGPDWDFIAQHFPDKKPSDVQQLVYHNSLISTNLNIFQHEMRRWSSEDVAKFRCLYEVHGQDWQTIADYLPGKTREDCLEYYHSHKDLFAETIKVTSHLEYKRKLIHWSIAERKLLKDLIEKYDEDFDRIAKFFPGRTSISIRTYYSQYREELGLKDQNEIEKKSPWTGNEENKLINLVRLYQGEWKQISNYLPNRSPEACKQQKNEWPKIGEALVIWIDFTNRSNNTISGTILTQKAKDFAKKLKITNFTASLGWLSNFKKEIILKNIIKQEKQQGPLTLLEIRPNKSLATGPITGTKNPKDRVTIMLTCNATGTHKLSPVNVTSKYKILLLIDNASSYKLEENEILSSLPKITCKDRIDAIDIYNDFEAWDNVTDDIIYQSWQRTGSLQLLINQIDKCTNITAKDYINIDSSLETTGILDVNEIISCILEAPEVEEEINDAIPPVSNKTAFKISKFNKSDSQNSGEGKQDERDKGSGRGTIFKDSFSKLREVLGSSRRENSIFAAKLVQGDS
ncbi:5027_t:CDS:10 [Diversispora eburnea]|uniref:5027_t:CDS:1 n=1 Tax=Diversispora eburnea TaxID=1213867 RepID=A0A9N8VDZ9_9GLOM|nr:5027_t:CDS:10 [Diversispora eburnea]